MSTAQSRYNTGLGAQSRRVDRAITKSLTTKSSSSIPGFTSPKQANPNMGGAAVGKPKWWDTPGAKDPHAGTTIANEVARHSSIREIRSMGRSFKGETRSQIRQRNTLTTGPRGGRYYISKNGSKVYVK